MKLPPPLGRHLLLECHGCVPALLADCERIEALLRRAAEAAGAHVLAGHFHPFGPGQGVTGVLLLRESHISIHSWPEFAYAALDLFMCGSAAPQRALAELLHGLAPTRHEVRELARGLGVQAGSADTQPGRRPTRSIVTVEGAKPSLA